MARVERYDDAAGDARFKIVADNNRILSASTEGYRRKADREHCVKESLLALIGDYGEEGMKELGWRRSAGDPTEPEPLDIIRAAGGHDIDSLAMYTALIYELHILSETMVRLLERAGVSLDEYGQCGLRERLEIIRAAMAATHTRPGDVFGRDDALKAYWILSKSKSKSE